MKTIKIAGVPEHFNFPWQLAIENKEFETENLNIVWTNVLEGTGKLCEMLRNETTDIAVILTEGIIKDIGLGNPSKIIQKYIESPLVWGIHVDYHSKFKTVSDLKTKKAAISRFGSGSHLMALVNAKNQGWDVENLDFEIVNTINGAVESLQKSESDYFMWEKFMTKPLVDKNIFRRIDECPTPWPSFVIVVRNNFLEENSIEIRKLLNIINKTTLNFKKIPNIENKLATEFNQKPDDIKEWMSITNWSQENFSEPKINKIQGQLLEFKIINKKTTFASLVKVL